MNHDGYISYQEFNEFFPGYEHAFNYIDIDGNKAISKPEIYFAIDALSGDTIDEATSPNYE